MQRLLATLMLLGLAGCATTNPYEAAGIDYRLPRTDAKVTLDLDVTQCIDPQAPNSDKVKFTSSLKIDPVASAQDKIYHLAGRALLTATTKRSITVDVDTNGVISSVNSTATDQTSAILGSVIKLAATVAAAAGNGQTVNVFVCKQATKSYVTLVSAIQAEISNKILALAAVKDQASQAAAQKEIDDLATRLAAYKAKLHAETTATFSITSTEVADGIDADNATHDLGTPLVFDPVPLSLLFDTFESGPAAPNPPNTADVSREKQDFIRTRAFFVRGKPETGIGGKTAPEPEPCSQYMSVPAGKSITVVLVPLGNGYGPLDATNSAVKNGRMTATMVASQLDDPAKVCLSAGFGENRNIALKFDSYGRTTEFTYAPDSRAANIAAGLAGAAPDAVTMVTSITGHSLAQDKKELDELQTHQSLVTARACEQAMNAGATSCPKN